MPILNTTRYGITVYTPQQPQSPMNESLEWVTEVYTAHDGSETRAKIRNKQRHIVEMNYPLQAHNNGRAINAIYGGINSDWLVPMWASARPATAIGPELLEIGVEADAFDGYVIGGNALVWESADRHKVVEISGFTQNGIAITEPLGAEFVGAYIVPMRKGRIKGSPKRSTNGHSAVLSVAFDVDDEIAGANICIAYDCSGSMDAATSNGKTRLQNEKTAIVQALEMLKDFGAGVFNLMVNAWGSTSSSLIKLNATVADISALQAFVLGSGGQGGTDFAAAVVGVPEFFAQANSAGRNIFVLLTDGEGTNGPAAAQTLFAIPKIKSYAANIELESTTLTAVLDNTPENGVPVLKGEDADGLTGMLTGAILGIAIKRYLNNDLDTNPIEIADALAEDVSGDIRTVDYQTGKRAYFMPWLNPKIGKTQRTMMVDTAEAYGFRAWLQRRAGKFSAFWRPTFENDFRLTSTGLIASTLLVRDDDYNQFGGIRKHIAVRLANGQWLPRTIVSHAGLPNNILQLDLDAPLNVQAGDIVCISYLGLHRLNTDRIEMQWNSGICVSEFTTIEVTP